MSYNSLTSTFLEQIKDIQMLKKIVKFYTRWFFYSTAIAIGITLSKEDGVRNLFAQGMNVIFCIFLTYLWVVKLIGQIYEHIKSLNILILMEISSPA